MPADDDTRLTAVELELENHAQDIRVLQEGLRMVQRTQGEHTTAIQELQSTSGQILAEVSANRRESKNIMGSVVDKLNEVSSELGKFRAVWEVQCNERHKAVDFRLVRVEKVAEARVDLDDMGETTKNLYVRRLEGDIVQLQHKMDHAHEMQEQEIVSQRKAVHERNLALLKAAGAAITALLTGGGGVLLVQWLLNK